jgi:hypothetical protein
VCYFGSEKYVRINKRVEERGFHGFVKKETDIGRKKTISPKSVPTRFKGWADVGCVFIVKRFARSHQH